jgi:hypothetical protein
MVSWRGYRLHGHDLASLAFTFVGSSAATGLTLLQFPQTGPGHWILGGAVVLAATAGSAVTLGAGNRTRGARDRARRQRLARSIVEDVLRGSIASLSARPDHTGAVVFLPSEDGSLQSVYTYNKRGKADGELRFEKWQGATGHAWGEQDQTIALLDRAPASDLRERWKLSADQIAMTAHLKVVVATPIWATDDSERMVGIVSIDSDLPDAECQLTSDRALDEAIQLAQLLAHVLTLADLV